MAISIKDYLIYSINNDLVCKLDWYNTFFTILDNFIDNSFLSIKGNGYYVLVNNEEVKLEKIFSTKTPILSTNGGIEIKKNELDFIDRDLTTTIGRLIINYVVIYKNFGKNVEYINKEFTPSDIEKKIVDKMLDGAIPVKNYLNFVDSVFFISSLSRLFCLSATPKSVMPPPNFKLEKKRIIEEFNKKYGPNWKSNKTLLVEFQTRLKEIDSEWLKDDPSNNKLLNSKIKDNARVKMFLSIGPEVGFDKRSSEVVGIESSLLEGNIDTRKEIAAMFNGSRAGSYDRGHETQKGGTVAKEILRSTSSTAIVEGDCKTKLTKKVYVTENNFSSLVNRYFIDKGSVELITEDSKIIGKTIDLRSPMFCKEPRGNICSTCTGKNIRVGGSGLSSSLLEISKILITTSLKSMHNSIVTVHNINLEETIK